MLRMVAGFNKYLARQLKKTRTPIISKSIQVEQDIDDDQKNLSEYEYMKKKFEKLDNTQGLHQNKSQQYPRSMDFYKTMLEQDEIQDNLKPKIKDKSSIIDKLRQMNTPQQLLRDINHKNSQQSDQMKSQLSRPISRQSLNNQQQSLVKQPSDEESRKMIEQFRQLNNINMEEVNKKNQEQLKLAQQDLLLEQIMKSTKEREVKIRSTEQKSKQNSQNLSQNEKKLLIRKEKILQALQNNQDPSKLKMDVTKEELLKMKYSPQIIQTAKQYRNHELGYFKKLILNDDHQTERSFLNKRDFKSEQDKNKYLIKKEQYKPIDKKVVQNSYKQIKAEEGLMIYEDQSFYKEKAMKQIKEKTNLTAQDWNLKQELRKDLDQGNKISDVFLDQVVFPQDARLERRMAYNQTSFGKQEKQLKLMAKKMENLGIDFSQQELKSLSKQLLFEEKHFLEQQEGFQKYLQKKQKKANMKKQLRKIHQNTLRDDLDFNKSEQPAMTVKQIKESSNIQILQENLQKLEEYQLQKQSILVTETPEEKKSKIHHKKTFKNMQNFIANYFANGLSNHNSNQLDQIQILQIIPNKTNTVLNIFWDIEPQYLQTLGIIKGSNDYEELFQNLKQKIEIRLKNQSAYISGKMTQFLKLRYGPDVRFFFDLRTKLTREAVDELKQYTKEIAMVELEQHQKKGHINVQEQAEYYEKLIDVSKDKLYEFNSRKQLLSKKYQKFNRQQVKQPIKPQIKAEKKSKRTNPMFQDKQIRNDSVDPKESLRKGKKKPSEKLWQTIQLL